MQSPGLLVHYNHKLPLLLSSDASPYGVGEVLLYITEEGKDQPITFASISLVPAEKNYSQLDKEALAIIFGFKKFHQYVFGRIFTICFDHKPLLRIFSESKVTPVMASARIQKLAVLLSTYNYTVSYSPGRKQTNADALSRLPLPEAPNEVPVPSETMLLLEYLSSLPMSAEQLRLSTARDPTLAKVK